MDGLHRDILDLQRKWRDYLDMPNEPSAKQMTNAIQRLEDDIQVKKSAGTVEGQINQLINQIDRLEETHVMSNSHLGELQRGFERMRDNVRKLK